MRRSVVTYGRANCQSRNCPTKSSTNCESQLADNCPGYWSCSLSLSVFFSHLRSLWLIPSSKWSSNKLNSSFKRLNRISEMMKNVRPARRRLRWQKIELELIFYRRPNVYNVLFKNKLRIACVSSTVLPENLGKRPQRSPKEIVRLCDRSSLSLRQSNEFCPKKYFGHCDNRSRFASRLVNGRWLIFFGWSYRFVPIRKSWITMRRNSRPTERRLGHKERLCRFTWFAVSRYCDYTTLWERRSLKFTFLSRNSSDDCLLRKVTLNTFG